MNTENELPRGATWIGDEELAYDRPLKRSPRKGLVRWPDGRLRTVRLGVADTFFTIPARGKKGPVTVHGFVYFESESEEYRFRPNHTHKNICEEVRP